MDKNPYMLVHLLEQQKLYSEFESWPLHVTIMPWFTIAGSEQTVIDELSDVVARGIPIAANVGDKALFGLNNDIRVFTVESPDQRLEKLRVNLLEKLGALGCQLIDESYVGERYSPHLTTEDPNIDVNDIFINEISLIQKGDNKIIVANL